MTHQFWPESGESIATETAKKLESHTIEKKLFLSAKSFKNSIWLLQDEFTLMESFKVL